jgi:two-component system sensor histidine kinase UhpB
MTQTLSPPVADTPQPRAWSWTAWPTRVRLIAVVLAIDVLAALVSCGIIVLNARSAVQVETLASLSTVESLVADTIDLSRTAPPESLLQTLDLRIQALRHVRVTLLDPEGRDVRFGQGRLRRDRHDAPAWFAALIAPPIRRAELPIVVNGGRIGTARIATEPLDEIDEIWGYTVSLSFASLCLNLGLLAALYVALSRVLAPLDRVAEGLTQLEHRDYAVRLDPPASRELAIITERFNSLAGALEEAWAANDRLTRKLLTAQDDERRRTALELHDEFGPCLFALEANAASVARIAEADAPPDRARLTARAGDIAAIVGQVQTLNRDLLNRLRPHGLGQVPLAECLDLLIRDFTRRHPETAFVGDFHELGRGYGDLVDLTVFRCIQESMTNAVRHGRAPQVRAEARERPAQDGVSRTTHLEIVVRDTGVGLASSHGVGLGLSGMRERVGALGGTFLLDNAAPGTVVRISIPLDPGRDEDTSPIVPA